MPLETPTAEVPAEAAYAAATNRALMTTNALILAEAQVLTLQQQVQRLEFDCASYAAQLQRYQEADQDTEVKHDATADEERPSPCCAARTPHHFSD